MSFPFWVVILSAVSRARHGAHPVPPRHMQRSTSKLCSPSSSLWSLQRRTVTSPALDTLDGHGTGSNRSGGLLQSRRSQAQDGQAIARKQGIGVVDRAANWAHVKPMWKRRVPPLGTPQSSLEKILKAPQDSVSDEMFNTELGERMLPTGSFLEIRRSVRMKCILLFVHDPECVETME